MARTWWRLVGLLGAMAACGPASPGVTPSPETTPRSPAAVAAPPVPKGQRVFAHPSGVRFDVAEGWRSEVDEDSMSLMSDDETAMLLFFVVDAADLETALSGLRETLAGVVDDPTMGKGAESDLNGLPTYATRGEGSLRGTDVSLGIALVQTPSSRVLIVLGIAEKGALRVTVEQIDTMVKSIRPHVE